MSRIAQEFDQIARLTETEGWNHNNHYHGFLLRQLPQRIERALDVGCGMGGFARLLALRAQQVTGIDLSPEMLHTARNHSTAYTNIDYQIGDVMALDLPTAHYDCIASIATLHHLPYAEALRKLRDSLKPGGVLLVLDLYQPVTLLEKLRPLAGMPLHLALRLRHYGIQRDSAAMRHAWRIHGEGDVYPTLADLRAYCQALLPGAALRVHVLWRCSIVWRRPPVDV
jgi:SAM-dependent methyltransferase